MRYVLGPAGAWICVIGGWLGGAILNSHISAERSVIAILISAFVSSVGFMMVASTSAFKPQTSDAEKREAALKEEIDPQVLRAAAEMDPIQRSQPEWVWYDNSVDDTPVTSTGRWAKHARMAPYIRADLVVAKKAFDKTAH